MEYPLSLARRPDGIALTADGTSVLLTPASVAGQGAGGVAPGGPSGKPGARQDLSPAMAQQVQQWQQHLAGNMAAKYSRYSSGLEGGYTSSTEYHLCRSGEFLLKQSSSTSVDVGGAYGYSGGKNNRSGTWRIITQGQLVGIELRYSDGEVVQARLDYQNGQTLVDGERWLIGRSEVCP